MPFAKNTHAGKNLKFCQVVEADIKKIKAANGDFSLILFISWNYEIQKKFQFL